MRKSLIAMAMIPVMMALVAPVVQAAGLQVSPTTVRMKHDSKAERLWLTASGTTPVTGQVRLYQWVQKDGEDVLTPSRDIVVSPPVITVPAGETQLLRLVNKVAPGPQEKAWRLVVDELPDGSRKKADGVQFLLKYSIPVFLGPGPETAQAAPGTALKGVTFMLRQEGGKTWLSVDNARATHVRLARLEYVTDRGTVRTLYPGLMGYVLSGSHMKWAVDMPAAAGHFRAMVNDETTPETLLSWSR